MLGQNLPKEEFTLSDPSDQPTDTVSSISWSKTHPPPTFATGSWDSHVRIYEVETEESFLRLAASFNAESPCLGVAWHEDGNQIFAGCASGDVKAIDMIKAKAFKIGHHRGPVKDVHWVAEMNLLCSVSFDKTVKLWDLRQSDPVKQYELRYKPIASDLHRNELAVALSDSQVILVDLAEAMKTQEGLKYIANRFGTSKMRDDFSCIKFLTDGERLAFGTSGGRGNIAEIEKIDPQTRKLWEIMSWKGHKIDGDRSDVTPKIYPMNSIFVNSKKPKNFIGTCGGEGNIICWDFDRKNKICTFEKKDPVTCGEMSQDGNWLAFATGNDWSRGISEHMTKRTEVFVRPVKDTELVYVK